jgi:hypothetical protein
MGNLRYSWRMLRKNPGLTAAVIATLMLGIGATTAIYTVVYAVLLAPLPYPHPEQLVMVWSKVRGHKNGMSAGDFLDWKEQSKSFQQLAARCSPFGKLRAGSERAALPRVLIRQSSKLFKVMGDLVCACLSKKFLSKRSGDGDDMASGGLPVDAGTVCGVAPWNPGGQEEHRKTLGCVPPPARGHYLGHLGEGDDSRDHA